MNRTLLVAMFLVACSGEQTTETVSDTEQAATVCGSGPTIKGIDVSYYQGTIDWTKVKADGVEYAFVRVSDGLATIDNKFDLNWSQTRAKGILHGAYQFFRPAQDPIAQADLLLSKIGTPMADDLPPVIDVEADGGLTPAQVAAKVKIWIDHVTGAIGKRPIVYTGYYFWRDQVGAPDQTDSPLWHAQYSTVACPNIAPPWQDWAFWQYTSSGSVNGIAGNVDMNRFNGTRAELDALLMGGGAPAAECAQLPAEGGTIDDGDACFVGGGPPGSMRHVATAGEGGDLVWTHTTEDAAEGNFGQWNMDLAEAGTYKIEVYTAASYAQSKQARYTIHANGADHDFTIDQSAADGWQVLGEVELAAGADQYVHLADNTGELLSQNVQLVFDAVRVTRVAPEDPGMGSGSGDDEDPGKSGGCNAGGASGLGGLALVLGALLTRRRRR
ncbi:MAG: GH25 family lysozyme [Polyangiales bacterium]